MQRNGRIVSRWCSLAFCLSHGQCSWPSRRQRVLSQRLLSRSCSGRYLPGDSKKETSNDIGHSPLELLMRSQSGWWSGMWSSEASRWGDPHYTSRFTRMWRTWLCCEHVATDWLSSSVTVLLPPWKCSRMSTRMPIWRLRCMWCRHTSRNSDLCWSTVVGLNEHLQWDRSRIYSRCPPEVTQETVHWWAISALSPHRKHHHQHHKKTLLISKSRWGCISTTRKLSNIRMTTLCIVRMSCCASSDPLQWRNSVWPTTTRHSGRTWSNYSRQVWCLTEQPQRVGIHWRPSRYIRNHQ